MILRTRVVSLGAVAWAAACMDAAKRRRRSSASAAERLPELAPVFTEAEDALAGLAPHLSVDELLLAGIAVAAVRAGEGRPGAGRGSRS